MEFLKSRTTLENTFNGRKVYSEYVNKFIQSMNIYEDMDNNFIDMWNERRVYGRVNSWNKPIFPQRSKIITKVENEIEYYGLDFVLDMFFEFKRYYETVSKKQKWTFNIDTTSLETFVHPLDLYHLYLINIFRKFNSVLQTKIVDSYYLNFNTYLKELCAVIDQQREKKVLFSSYILSVDYDLVASGLVIDLTTADYFNDKEKVEKFFEKTHYKFLVESARRFGFLVDKNVPWRLVVDLNSFASSYFIKRRRELNLLKEVEVLPEDLNEFLANFSTENDQYMMKNGKELLIDIFHSYYSLAYWEGSGEVNLFVDAAKDAFVEFKNNKNLGCINNFDNFYLMNFYRRVFEREIGLFNVSGVKGS